MVTVLSYGEIMLRLTAPNYLRLDQTEQVRMDFVGTGVNVLASLRQLGHCVMLSSAVPDNNLGQAAVASMRKLDIGTEYVDLVGSHLGSFFVETGYGLRRTEVTYQNRLNSSFCTQSRNDSELTLRVRTAEYIHICGITLSLTDVTRHGAFVIAKGAKTYNKKVYFDFNYRPSLNETNELLQMRTYYEQMLPYCYGVFGNLKDLTILLGMEKKEGLTDAEQLIHLGGIFMEKYDISVFAGTIREEGDKSRIRGFILTKEETYFTHFYDLTTLDRIGAGDAYAAGVIHGLSTGWSLEKTAHFSVANSVLAHATFGDIPRATEAQIDAYLKNPHVRLIR